jgi:hypothetical protein
VNVRELIELLNQAADHMPDGLDSSVRVYICNGWDADGLMTKEVAVATGEEDDGTAANSVIIQGPPAQRRRNTVRRPVAEGVDDELARLAAGDPLPRPGVAVVLGDTGEGVRIPYDEDGRPLLPGAPDAMAAGCMCDPEKNAHGLGIPKEDDTVAMVTNNQCEIHRRVKIDSNDIPPDEND